MSNSSPSARGALQKLRSWRNQKTNVCRLIHGAADGWNGLYVDRLADYLLVQTEHPLTDTQQQTVQTLRQQFKAKGVYHKRLNRQVQKTSKPKASARLIMGIEAPEFFEATEHHLRYRLSFNEGYSTGLFLDMRDNRHRLLSNLIELGFPVFDKGTGAAKVLNTFAYTCSLSVCAARAGAITTSLDLSQKYLEWGRENFRLNKLNPDDHDFIYGDTFDWMKRLAKRGEQYDLVILDPPTFSRSKVSGLFQAKRDYGRLAGSASALVRKNGMLLACCNAGSLAPSNFKADIRRGIRDAGRKILQNFQAMQPLDFPVGENEQAYLKAFWLRLN